MQAEIWGPGTVMESPITDGFVQLEGLIIRKTVAKWKGHGFKSPCRWRFQMLSNVFQLNSELLSTGPGFLSASSAIKKEKQTLGHLCLLKYTFISVTLCVGDAG